jgi:hypothetical protein
VVRVKRVDFKEATGGKGAAWCDTPGTSCNEAALGPLGVPAAPLGEAERLGHVAGHSDGHVDSIYVRCCVSKEQYPWRCMNIRAARASANTAGGRRYRQSRSGVRDKSLLRRRVALRAPRVRTSHVVPRSFTAGDMDPELVIAPVGCR